MPSCSLSVILCSYNPDLSRLEKTLTSLKEQTLPQTDWELFVVDNASTQPIAPQIDISWHPRGQVIHESKAGLAHARICGCQQAKAELIIFVDDDNRLAPDYLETALQIQHDFPALGAWGGQCILDVDTAPPQWVKPYLGNLAVREFEQDCWSSIFSYQALPFGSGLCILKKVVTEYEKSLTHPLRKSFGTQGDYPFRGEDSDMVHFACDLGLGIGLFEKLKLNHMIHPKRFDQGYILKLIEETHFSNSIVGFLHKTYAPMQCPAWKEVFKKWRVKLTESGFRQKVLLAKLRGLRRANQLLLEQ